MPEDEAEKIAREIVDDYFDADEHDDQWLIERIADALRTDEPDIFTDALASQIDAIRRATFDEAIAAIPEVGQTYPNGYEEDISARSFRKDVFKALEAARDSTEKPRSDKGKHHHVAGVLQEDVDEAEN